jgi:hypothetical protein
VLIAIKVQVQNVSVTVGFVLPERVARGVSTA